jgi:hypothetical protein
MSSNLTGRFAFNENLDIEARIFSACFVRTLHNNGTNVFTSREVQDVAQCTFNALEKIHKQHLK